MYQSMLKTYDRKGYITRKLERALKLCIIFASSTASKHCYITRKLERALKLDHDTPFTFKLRYVI